MSIFPLKNTYRKIIFKYSQTLGKIAFNYAKNAKNLDVNDVDMLCSCEDSRLKDDFHKLVIMDNLDILNDTLISNFKQWSKFRHTKLNKIINNKYIIQ